MIATQIDLSPRVALRVVLQGIRVRFGRSLVTVLGVALGIAFLMSVLAGQVIKAGVAGEQAIRSEVSRAFNFFVAESGLPQGMSLGIVQLGALNEVETRLLERLVAVAGESRWWAAEAAPRPSVLGPAAAVPRAEVGRGTTALLVLGAPGADAEDLRTVLGDARHRLVFVTRETHQVTVGPDDRTVGLARAPQPDELEKLAREARKARFRNTWIVVIALCVTVIGIANSMLMSVTERFREIGTMKCLGALASFVRQMFLIESSLVGLAGSVAGALAGALFSLVAYGFTYGFGLVLHSVDFLRLLVYSVLCVGVGVLLAVIAAFYPARIASRMLPAYALRSEI